ncbi:NAD(P)/FAD-dependent oxidoreductase [Amycolatopsis sp. GM8]|uniref:FAD-dependent oxidoreductase n=1 Tax=Amycolatopsis sp. GM8 TaxID=2896530 RepID=UPI001F1D1BC5|nr:NAD(P)/FAD-dependent oxidoreductase [Amycolatopsis sp. GM8]
MRVIVAGAGIGGLTLAQGLRQAGIDVTVYERDGPDGRPQGVSLHIDDRGAGALRACLPPAHLAMVEATMGAPRERTLVVSEVDGRLSVVRSQPLDATTAARPGRPVNRRLLRAVLLTGLEDVVRFDAGISRFEQCPDGTVRAWFADGSTDTADVLVGADGIGSAVRRQYLPQAQVIDTGKRMVMGATPLRAVADTRLLELIGDSATNAQVRGTTMVLAALRFTEPPVIARRKWLPALSSATVDNAEDYLMWTVPGAQAPVGHPALRQILDQAWPDLTVELRIAMIPPVPPWPAGPVTLIGDAIHLAPGFGANLAMRDAQRLRDALAERPGDPHTAIGAYEETMRRESWTRMQVPVPPGPG